VGLVNAAPAISAKTECATKTQWTWAFKSETTTSVVSSVILSVAEDNKQAGAAGASPYYYSVGGMNLYATYGLGNWGAIAVVIGLTGKQIEDATSTDTQKAIAETKHPEGVT